jgi:hypothetical protein
LAAHCATGHSAFPATAAIHVAALPTSESTAGNPATVVHRCSANGQEAVGDHATCRYHTTPPPTSCSSTHACLATGRQTAAACRLAIFLRKV